MLSFLERLVWAKSIEEVWSDLTKKMADYGFDRLLYGCTTFKTARSLGDPADHMMLSNHPQEYLERFINGGMFINGPMVRWAIDNEGSCSWRRIQELANRGELTQAEKEVVEFNRQHGVVAGYSLSFPSLSARTKGGLALIARRGLDQDEVDEIWERHGREIEVICNVAHLKIMSLPFHGLRPPLTDRQREVLEWVGEGKTTQDIATIMGLTPATVEKHLRLARHALDVETTAQAVLKASVQNQIFVIRN